MTELATVADKPVATVGDDTLTTKPPIMTAMLIVRPMALLVVWFGGAAVALYLKRTQLLIGFDGGYMMNLAHRQFEWGLPLFSQRMDWFQGLGDIFLGMNFRLLPSFVAASFVGNVTASKVVIYEVVLCELSVATFLFGITLGATRIASIAAALVTCLAFLPFGHPSLIYGILALAPQTGSLIAIALLTASAFLRFGRRNWRADLPFALATIFLLSWYVLIGITTLILAFPFLLLCVVSGIIAAKTSGERRCKIALFAVAGLFLGACGPAIYLVGTVLDTAAVVFPIELTNDRASFFFASILFHWNTVGPVGPLLVVFGVAGAVLAISDQSRRTLRIFAITLLTYLGTRLTFAMLVIAFDFWRGPAALYFEFFVIPLYALFAAYFCGRLLTYLWKSAAWASPSESGLEIGLVSGAIVIALLLAVSAASPNWGFHYPPKLNPVTDILSREVGEPVGSKFRGRVANMVGRSISRDINWLDLHVMDANFADMIGSDFRVVGLHYFGIPGLFQYTPTISPFFYAVSTRLLAFPADKQTRSVLVLRKIDPRILAMLGVRFVVTDGVYDDPAATLRANVAIRDRTLFLYEIANANVGDYSPTTVNTIHSATEMVARMASPNFKPANEVIADVPMAISGLVRARNVRLTFEGAALRLQAESDGKSILLVPLEFSKCLEAAPVAYEKPIMFRANLVETGILFSGRVDAMLSIRTGAFLNPSCRLRDFFDARALDLGKLVPASTLAGG